VEYRIDATTILSDEKKIAKTRGESVDVFSGESKPQSARPSTGVFVGMAMAKQ